MKSLNIVQLIGNLGSDPEIKEYDGKIISKFSIATGDEWMDKSTNEKRCNTEWHRVVCFDNLAKITKDYLKKGMKIYIAGKVKTSKWQDKSNENRYTTEIILDDLIMLESKPSSLANNN